MGGAEGRRREGTEREEEGETVVGCKTNKK